MKIFVDFDDVIFNTYRFKNKFFAIFRKGGFTRKEVERAAKDISSFSPKSKGVVYSPERHIKELEKNHPFDKAEMKKDIRYFLKNIEEYVFSDCLNFFKSIPKKDLYLLSYGEINFQKKKIFGSGADKYFGNIIITKGNKLKEIIKIAKEKRFKPEENILLLDDRPDNLQKTKELDKKIITFHVCRPEGRFSNLVCREKDWEVKDLKEALEIIKREKFK